MHIDRTGQIAVMFVSHRTDADAQGYPVAAIAMEALAAAQPGYRGIASAQGDDGLGITISYWADAAAAIRWRDHPDHAAMRERGRAIWYESYDISVAAVERSYGWRKA